MNINDSLPPEHTPSAAPEAQTNEQKLQTMLRALWERSRQTVADRALLLQNAGHLLHENHLDEATRLRAVDSAHKLAGVLGTFGLPRGTDLARKAEVLFGQPTKPGNGEVEHFQILLEELVKLVERGPQARQ